MLGSTRTTRIADSSAVTSMGLEKRDIYELFWVRHQPLLLEKGYLLRPRYAPNWTPPWLLPDAPSADPWDNEDAHIPIKYHKVMDAIRLRDGLPVVFKRTPYNSPEIQMLQILSDRRLDVAENGAVDLLEVINIPVEKEGDPAEALIVMPKHIHFHRVQFHCRSEVAHFMRNVLETVEFLHQRHITHGDLGDRNIVMDYTDVCPDGYHFASLLGPDGFEPLRQIPRCQVPFVEYYLIDFEGSLWCSAGRASAAVDPDHIKSQWRCAPELNQPSGKHEMINPFALDIYNLGKTFYTACCYYVGLDDFQPLFEKMTAADVSMRPSAVEALHELNALETALSSERSKELLEWTYYVPPHIQSRICAAHAEMRKHQVTGTLPTRSRIRSLLLHDAEP
ncbi:hypothetical protein CPB85DRAFT_193044 [Mucidula mucida]|nr:hypothetical protein CPB85DRAFT_193044 [Mucidula mucida]